MNNAAELGIPHSWRHAVALHPAISATGRLAEDSRNRPVLGIADLSGRPKGSIGFLRQLCRSCLQRRVRGGQLNIGNGIQHLEWRMHLDHVSFSQHGHLDFRYGFFLR